MLYLLVRCQVCINQVASTDAFQNWVRTFCHPANSHIVWYALHGLPHIYNGKLNRIAHFLLNLGKLFGTVCTVRNLSLRWAWTDHNLMTASLNHNTVTLMTVQLCRKRRVYPFSKCGVQCWWRIHSFVWLAIRSVPDDANTCRMTTCSKVNSRDMMSSASFLAEISVGLPRKLIILII